MWKVKRFIETTYGSFINIDFITSFKKDMGYFITLCDGQHYELNDYKEAENLFEYLKGQVIDEFEPRNHVYD